MSQRLTRDARECALPTQHIGRSAYTNMEDDDLQVYIKLNFHMPSFYGFIEYSVHPGVYISRFCCSFRRT